MSAEAASVTRPRVAVTGLGIICGLGRDQREFWAHATEGQSGIRSLSLFDATGCLSDIASQVDDLRPPDWLDPICATRDGL